MRCPQGSCLSPLLFLFFINDLPNASKSFSLGIVYFISPAHLERCSSWDVVQWSHPIPSVRHIASDLNWPWSNWQNFRILTKLGFRRPLAAKNLAGSSGDDHFFFQNFNVSLGAFGAGPFWIILGHSRAILGYFWPFWFIFGHFGSF